MKKIVATYFHESFELTLLKEDESSITLKLDWDKEIRERYYHLYKIHEADDGDYEFWYLDNEGDRLSDHELFEKSPWAIIQNGVKEKVISRTFGFDNEARFQRGLYENQWKYGTYTDIKFDQLPDFYNLNIFFHSNLHTLWKSYNDNPYMTLEHISFIDDILNQSRINIAFSRRIVSSGKITENQVRCDWDCFNVILAYTLVKDYNGQPTFFDKETLKHFPISKEDYLNKVETAFQKSDIPRA
jgi:hypothetical protein